MIEENRKGPFLLKRATYHEADAVSAIRRREHPNWSRLKCDARVAA